MARFNYAMQNILNIKEKIEEQKRMELGQAMMVYQNEVDEEKRVNRLLDKTVKAFVEGQRESHPVSEFVRLNNSVNFYEDALKMQKVQVLKAYKVVEKKREALKLALMEKQIQEKLKEKALEAFLEEEKMKEQKILDEIVSYRYSTENEH